MDTRQLLEQILRSGNDFLAGSGKQNAGGNTAGGGLGDMLSGGSGGLLAGSVLGLLLGTKKGRKMGAKLLKYGSLAALGTVAYQAYSRSKSGGTLMPGSVDSVAQPQAVSQVAGVSDEQRSLSVLKAMIGAAKADGHIDDRERSLIVQGMGELTQDGQTRQWVEAELTKPVNAADVALASSSPENAAEMFLVSVLVIDDENALEKIYLDELARELNIDAALRADLEAQVRG